MISLEFNTFNYTFPVWLKWRDFLENSAEMLEICYNMVEISRKLKLNDSPKSFQNQPSSAKQYDQLEPLDGCSKAVGKVGQWADRREKLDK